MRHALIALASGLTFYALCLLTGSYGRAHELAHRQCMQAPHYLDCMAQHPLDWPEGLLQDFSLWHAKVHSLRAQDTTR